MRNSCWFYRREWVILFGFVKGKGFLLLMFDIRGVEDWSEGG